MSPIGLWVAVMKPLVWHFVQRHLSFLKTEVHPPTLESCNHCAVRDVYHMVATPHCILCFIIYLTLTWSFKRIQVSGFFHTGFTLWTWSLCLFCYGYGWLEMKKNYVDDNRRNLNRHHLLVFSCHSYTALTRLVQVYRDANMDAILSSSQWTADP